MSRIPSPVPCRRLRRALTSPGGVIVLPLGALALGAFVLAASGCASSDAGKPSSSGGAPAGSGGGPGAGGGGGAGSVTGGRSGGSGATGSGGSSGGFSGVSSGGAGAMTGSSGGGNLGSGGQAASAGASGTARPFLSEDFEAGLLAKQPAGWDNFISYQKNNANPDGSGTMAVIDATRAHGGRNSVHFHGGGSPAMLTRPLAPGTNRLYVRGYFYLSRQLGMNPGANHETLIGIRKKSGDANDEVRFGEIKGVIGTNEVPTDNISPKMDQWGKGPVVPANQWACIEVAFLADQPQHTLQAWVDGVLVHSITAGDQWQNGVLPMNWMAGKFVEVIVGWHSFSNATVDIWMDDLALGDDRIGCN